MRALFTAGCVLLLLALRAAPPPTPRAASPRVPVIVELFTSEGCSSCPPADALLAELDEKQPFAGAQIIALEEHVDYWNHDGWRDPFSSSIFTERQEEYARHFRIPSPYTPQMVVGGRTEFSGSARSRVPAAISAAVEAPQAELALSLAPGPEPPAVSASVRVERFPAGIQERADVLLAVSEDALSSNVGAGENAGRHLEHRAVVRKLLSAGRAEPGKSFSQEVKIALDRGWKREHLHVVALLEGHSSGQIFGAASAAVAP